MGFRCKFPVIGRLLFVALLLTPTMYLNEVHSKEQPPLAPGVSGIAVLEDGEILSVHDVKPASNEETTAWLGLFRLPKSNGGYLTWENLKVDFSTLVPPPKDLESISPIPGTNSLLIAESGALGANHRRIFKISKAGDGWRVTKNLVWPWPVKNVEGMEVCKKNDTYFFASAERSQGLTSVEITWSVLNIQNFQIGTVQRTQYTPPNLDYDKGYRLISSLACDTHGTLWGASAYDPRDDSGPFKSVIFEIGRFSDSDPLPSFRLSASKRYLTLPGFKVEGLSIDKNSAHLEVPLIFIATDDEGMGGALRKLKFK